MKRAHEIFETSDKREIGAYFVALDELGLSGQLAKLLLRAQRTGDREARAAKDPSTSPYGDYARLMKSRNEFAIRELIMFCTEPWHQKGLRYISLKRFNYGIRLTIRHQPSIRFRRIDSRWRGDGDNLPVICALCDRLMLESDGDESKHTGKLFSWPTAI